MSATFFVLTSADVLLQHRWTKSTPLTLRMATLLNIHVASAPTVPVIPKITMSTLGLLTRAVNRSQVANPTNMEPEDYNAAAHNNQADVWWLAMPTEMFEAMTPPTGIPTTLKGNCMSPRWDKLILSATPTLAMFTLYFHATKLHLESSSWNKVKLMCLNTNMAQQRKRLGQSTVNLFNRGYNMTSQLQIEKGQHCGPRVHQQQHQLWTLCGRVQQLPWCNNG